MFASSFISVSLEEDNHQRLAGRANRSSVSGGACHKKPSLDYQSSITRSRYHSSNSSTSKIGGLSHQVRASYVDANNNTQPSNNLDHAALQSSQDVFARMHPNMLQQYTCKQDGVKNPSASYSRENTSLHSRTSWPRTSTSPQDNYIARVLSKKEEKSRAISKFESQIDSQHSLSTSSGPLRNSLKRSPDSNGSSLPSNPADSEAAFHYREMQHAKSNATPQRRGVPTFLRSHFTFPNHLGFISILSLRIILASRD